MDSEIIALISQFDTFGIRLIQQNQQSGLNNLMLSATWLGNTSTLLVIAVIGALACLFFSRRRWGVAFILSMLATWGYSALKLLFNRPRPHSLYALMLHDKSFPSGHAADSVAIYGLIGYLIWRHAHGRFYRWLGLIIGIGLPLLIGVTRVYLGAHFPTDVIGGWCIAAAVLFLLIKILDLKHLTGPKDPKSVEPPLPPT